jgi:hypothetical protein
MSTPLDLDGIRTSGRPIVIFGVGCAGRALFRAARARDLAVAAYCDNNTAKCGRALDGIPVVHAPQVPAAFPDPVVLIAVADIQDIVAQLGRLGITRWSDAGLLRGADLGAMELPFPPDYVEYAVATCLFCHESWLSPGLLRLRSVDVIVTERCSMRCRDCSNLMQYYEHPQDLDRDEVTAGVDALCDAVDGINELRVIGGEPMMNREWHHAVRHGCSRREVGRVVIYTNGTILPRPEAVEALRDPKVVFMVTDYGAQSRQLPALRQMLERERIVHLISPAQNWVPCSRIHHHRRSDEANDLVFQNCCAKNLLTLSDGMLFRCPFSANAVRLGAVPAAPGDLVHLTGPHAASDRDGARRRIRDLVLGRKRLAACDWCDGRFLDAPQVKPGIQVPKPLPYDRVVAGPAHV